MKSGILRLLLNKRNKRQITLLKAAALIVFSLFFCADAIAQTAAAYNFSATTGTYASIAATGIPVAITGNGMLTNDGNTPNIPIGFNFYFCGNLFTSVSGCANGVLSLSNNGASASVSSSNISGQGFLMAMWSDNYGDGGTPQAFYQTSGTPGSRVFTLEWTNFDICCVTTAAMNFQVKLFEATNMIQFCYGSFGVSPSGTIGIANSTTDYLTLPNAGSTTANTSFNTTSQPATGTILAWVPPCGPGSILPAIVSVTGGGGYCAGGPGVNVGVAGGAIGIDYQLYLNGSPVGSPVPGPGYGFSFGLQTTGGTYTATATNHITGCTSSMAGSALVYVYTPPNVWASTGGGTYCPGGTGVHIGVANSDPGVNYRAFFGTTAVGPAIPGTGAALDLGLFTAAGNYTVQATVPVTGCTSVMTGSPAVVINSTPVAYTVTGGGGYCVGGSGTHVGLSNSDIGINYQLIRNNSVTVGSSISGTGSALDFGAMTTGGTYTVIATDVSAGCVKKMNGSALVYINSLPAPYYVTGGGNYCAGGVGVPVMLAGSVTRNMYQLYLNGSAVGSAMAGTGLALNFGLQTAGGVYTVVATNTTTGCVNNMLGSVIVTVVPLPTVFNVTGGGNYCSGYSGTHIGLDGSTFGVNYQLYRGTTRVGFPLRGTGSPLDFGLQTVPGTYSVVGIVPGVLCTNNMNGSVNVGVNPLPTAYTVTGGGAYCQGGSGVHIYLSGSDAGVNYQLYRNPYTVGAAVAGTGGILDFGLQTSAGVYTIVAVSGTTGCIKTMNGNASVSITSLPTAYAVMGGGGYCSGGAGVAVTLPLGQYGVLYQLYNGATAVGSPLTGLGRPLNFGMQTAAGTYTIVGSSVVTGCVNNMLGSVPVIVNNPPTAYTVTGGGTGCTGAISVTPGLSGSDAGVNYQLYKGTIAMGSPVSGTGSAISFAPQTTSGTYTVVAHNTSTGCTSNMSGSAAIVIGTPPSVLSMTGGGSYCSGGTGVHLGLSGSASGVSYQLLLNGSPAGAPVAGNGLPADFGLQTSAGIYTAIATNSTTSCTSNMSGSKTVAVNPVPATYTVSGGGGYCSGGTGVHIYLSGSNTGITYRLLNSSGTPYSTAITGTGGSLDFGLVTAGSTYTIQGTTAVYGCTAIMSGNANVTVNAHPTVTGLLYTVAPSSNISLIGSPSGGTWSTGNSSVATVNPSTGIVTGATIGTAVISYTLPTGCAGTHTILVTATGHKDISDEPVASAATSLSVIPNPNRGTFAVKGSIGTDKDINIMIEINDMVGKSVYSNKVVAANGELNETIILNNIPNGMYLLSVRSESSNNVFHIVVER